MSLSDLGRTKKVKKPKKARPKDAPQPTLGQFRLQKRAGADDDEEPGGFGFGGD